MPKHRSPPLGIGGTLALGALFGAIAWACASATPLQLLCAAVVIGAMALWSWHAGRASTRRLRALAAARPHDSICTFARRFDYRAVDTWVIRAVYEELQAELAHVMPRFPLRATDSLAVLEIDPDALDMVLAPAVAARTGRSLEGVERNPHWGRVKTVDGLVRFFDAQPRVAV